MDTKTGITLVQHPRERFHPLGTARIARLGLTNLKLSVAFHERTPPALPPGATLLYPGPGARELSELGGERPSHLVVLDGTWHHARVLYRDLPWLKDLPTVRIAPDAPSRYRIRREPAPDCLSTIEAIVLALRALEPDNDALLDLLRTFDGMIDGHLEAASAAERQHREKRPRPGGRRRMPEAFWRPNILVVYAEFVARRGKVSLMQWTAENADTGETFEALLGPVMADPALPERLRHMRLLGAEFSVGEVEFLEHWTAFAGADPILAAWNKSTFDALSGVWSHAFTPLILKAVYSNQRPGLGGTLEEVLSREGWSGVPRRVAGRAGERLGNALAVLQALRGEASLKTAAQADTPFLRALETEQAFHSTRPVV